MFRFTLIGFLALAAGAMRASPGSDVREGVERLRSESSYAWVVTSTTEGIAPAGLPRPGRRSAGRVIATGRQDRESVAIVTMPNPGLGADVTAVRIPTKMVAQTPLGWLTPEEIQQAYRERRDADVQFAGRTVRLFQCLAAAQMALEQDPPEQELARLLTELGGFDGTREEVSGQLKPEGALATAFSPAMRGSITNHKLEGTVTFRFRGARLVEYQVNVAGKVQLPGAPGEREISHQQVTKLSGFGATMVVAPPAAFARLIQ